MTKFNNNCCKRSLTITIIALQINKLLLLLKNKYKKKNFIKN